MIEIHEFSTGIEPERTLDGGWISRGFTGNWHNCTLSKVPDAVEQAISSNEFEARSISALNPAIIGRVVQGKNNDYWSVVAVVTSGKDESRRVAVYRYFLCEGKDNLYLIVGWLKEQASIPIFDPFLYSKVIYINHETAKKYSDEANHYETQINNNHEFRNWLSQSSPRILNANQYNDVAVIASMANLIAQNKNDLVSWSYNVQALEKPESFLVIQPASPEAYNIFHSVERSTITNIGTTNATELKSALQGLMKPENISFNLKIIDNILETLKGKNVASYKVDFDKIFDKLGASDALKNHAYHHGMMELLTLRAILQPETLVNEYYLSYAQINDRPHPTISFKNNPIRQQSLEFQAQLSKAIINISSDLPNIKLKLRDGLLKIIAEIYPIKNVSMDDALWLIGSNESVWNLGSKELLASVRHDLTQIYTVRPVEQLNPNSKNLTSYNLWKDLINYFWKTKQNGFTPEPLPTYEILGKLFLELEQYDLAYYFYKISTKNYRFSEKILQYLKDNNLIQVFGLPSPRNEKRERRTTHSQNYSDSPAKDKWFWLHIALYLLFFALVITSRINGEQNIWITGIFVFVSIIFLLVYLADSKIRYQINKHSFPVVMFMALLANPDYLIGDFTNNSKLKSQPNYHSSAGIFNPLPTKPAEVSINIDNQTLTTAITSFDTTRKAINQIKNNLKTNQDLQIYNLQDKDIISALKTTIHLDDDFDYKSIENAPNNPNNQQKLKDFLNAIYIYQYKKGIKSNITGQPDAIIAVPIDSSDRQSTMSILQREIQNQIIIDKDSLAQ